MDSLELPFDLIWEGKPEPLSPADLALANAEDVLIYNHDFADGELRRIRVVVVRVIPKSLFVLWWPGFGLTNSDYLKSEQCEDEATSPQMCALQMLLELQQQALAIDSAVDDDDDDDQNSNIGFELVADEMADMEMGELFCYAPSVIQALYCHTPSVSYWCLARKTYSCCIL